MLGEQPTRLRAAGLLDEPEHPLRRPRALADDHAVGASRIHVERGSQHRGYAGRHRSGEQGQRRVRDVDVVSEHRVDVTRAQMFGTLKHGRDVRMPDLLRDEVHPQSVSGARLVDWLPRERLVLGQRAGARTCRVQGTSGV